MASSKTLNARNLEALGAARLAQLLIEASVGQAATRRRLRLELAGEAGPEHVTQEVAKRLATLAKARTFIKWNRIRPLATDLAAQHRAIVEVVARADPRQALDLLWRLMALVDPIMARCNDKSGQIGAVFRLAAADLAPLAIAADAAPEALARQVFGAVRENRHAQFDGLIARMAPALGAPGLMALRQALQAWGREHPGPPTAKALREIADALGDVDAYIAQFDDKARRVPGNAAEIADRLRKVGRLDEAWRAIEAVGEEALGPGLAEWRQARVETLEALGRGDEAQAFRWACFLSTLDAAQLRGHLKRLPDFDDIEAEDRAMAIALDHPDFNQALAFLIDWPALDQASALVLARVDEHDGDRHELLTRAADALEARHPLAATVARREVIDFTLAAAWSSRYGHAARRLAECADLAARIESFAPHPGHEDYLRGLRTAHGRKTGFWRAVAKASAP